MSKKALMAALTGLYLSSLLTLDVHAAEVRHLYEEEVPVLTQGRQERFKVLQTALRNVMIRVSGRSDAELMPGMDVQLKQASRYVQQFRYRLSPEPVIEPVSGKETKQILWIRFNEKAVNQLLLSQRLPVWGKTRPAALVWLVIDDRKQRQLIGNDSAHKGRKVFNEKARVRGLPLRFPLLDLTDRSSISISDIWANFEDSILAASRRYQAEAVLVGRVYQEYSGAWRARWSLYSQGRRQDWESDDELLDGTVAHGVNQASDFLAMRFAQVQQEGQQSQVLIKVDAVKGLADFNKVRSYLDSLSTVTNLQPYHVSSNTVTFLLTTRGGRLAVEQAISLGSTLVTEQAGVVVNPGTTPLPNQVEMVYRLIQ